MMRIFAGLWKDQGGEDLTEYALLLVLVSLAAVSAMNSLASGIKAAFSNVASALNAAT
jgi:Flp pilus assembly pilin Flp